MQLPTVLVALRWIVLLEFSGWGATFAATAGDETKIGKIIVNNRARGKHLSDKDLIRNSLCSISDIKWMRMQMRLTSFVRPRYWETG
jgi:hypothetical protein